MAEKKMLTKVARARVSEKLYLKMQDYADKHHCGSSEVVRDALKFFLKHPSTNNFSKIKRA